jgi:hypothetical protein
MCRQKRLALLKENPRVAKNLHELCGFIFLHELKHFEFYALVDGGTFSTLRHKHVERRCTEFAHEHWKPVLPEHVQYSNNYVKTSCNNLCCLNETQLKNFEHNANKSEVTK